MNSSTYITFSALDYRGVDALSSYALPITPFTFVPDIQDGRLYNIIWDFGDGTISKSFSAQKYYNFPGEYIVSLIIYDCNDNALISNETKTLRIYDYYPLTFDIKVYAYLLNESGFYVLNEDGEYVLISYDKVNFTNGEIYGPFKLTSYYPWYQPSLDVYYDIKQGNCKNYWDIYQNKYSHLDSYNCVYGEIYNYSLSSFQYNEIEKIQPTTEKLYLKISNGQIVSTYENDVNSCFAGIKGNYEFYIKNDAITDELLVDFYFDKTNYKNPYYENFNYLNSFGLTLSATVSDGVASRLSITSNGLDGEGYSVNSFDISPIKFENIKIPIVIKIKDGQNFDLKNFDVLNLSSFNISLSCSNVSAIQYSISSLNYTLSSQGSGGAFRGFIQFHNVTDVLSNVRINLSGTFINDQLSSYSLTGQSNYFNVYSKNYYDMYKTNENFNAAETLKEITFQETIKDKDVLYYDFLGSILGYNDLDHDDIGVKTYERISNFVQNTQDLDTCGVDFLNSLGDYMNYVDNFEERYVYPDKIKRIVDLLSIDRNKLTGTTNKFNQNFDVKGRVSKDVYGRNIGDQINTKTYRISAGTPIVALEKFSNKYTMLNTYQPVSAVNSYTYPLSSYTSDWGWPLVLPTTFDFKDVEKYYLFFEFVQQYDNTVLGNVIDFTNVKTTLLSTITTSQINSPYGIATHLLMDTIYQSLSLL